MRVHVDRDRCIGSGNCVMTDEEVFDQDDEGKVVLLENDPGAEHDEAVRTAVASCPVQAISAAGPAR
ncbi:ferredoxin [Streptomyces sp. NPDC095613]|uniref:ferredoxin n=1 Tax=Streptomyces sp. NPDC095613 TaxID=3155540 RepID=UPI00332B2964